MGKCFQEIIWSVKRNQKRSRTPQPKYVAERPDLEYRLTKKSHFSHQFSMTSMDSSPSSYFSFWSTTVRTLSNFCFSKGISSLFSIDSSSMLIWVSRLSPWIRAFWVSSGKETPLWAETGVEPLPLRALFLLCFITTGIGDSDSSSLLSFCSMSLISSSRGLGFSDSMVIL